MNNLTTKLFADSRPRKIYSVTEVNRIAKTSLETFTAWVHGEIAELDKIRTKFGNYFVKFKLKDEVTEYTLPVIAWWEVVNNCSFDLLPGIEVVIFGNLTLYEKLGDYQFSAEIIELYGEGILAAKFEQLKRKLRSEGLFDAKYKKPIPDYPTRIGVITSETGAAWIDFKKHTIDKFPFLNIFLANVYVQGKQAIDDLVWAIERLNNKNLDVMVITRGGGSLEDLTAFNSEQLARAIFASKTPVIAAIGHERDETIAQWVADSAASTPTAAAKLITAKFEEFLLNQDQLAKNLSSQTEKFYQSKLLELSLLEKEFEEALRIFIRQNYEQLENIGQSLKFSPKPIFQHSRGILTNLAKALELLSPQKVLERGYSLTYKLPENKIVTSSSQVRLSSQLKIRFAKGKVLAKVQSIA